MNPDPEQPPIAGARSPRRMAYLSAQHPMLSMTFIVREIAELQRLGFDIEIASVNDSDRPRAQLTQLEAEQSDKTYYIKAHGIGGAVAAHALTLLQRPLRYLAGWRLVRSLGGWDLRALAMHAFYFSEALMLGAWMQRRRLLHVHVHLGAQPATVGLLAKRVFDIGLSITVHGADEFYDAHRQHLGRKVAAADFIVCISNFARSQLMFVSDQQHWSRLVVARLGIDASRFAAVPYGRTRAEAPFRILSVGRLSAAKGQQILVQAVRLLRERGRPVQLNIVGGGPNAPGLQRLIDELELRDVVTMAGPVNQDHILAHYQQADCFALASFAEGIPVVLMEAMSMQIPCVTTHITGIPELIDDGRTGLLVPPSDVDSLAAALERLVLDPALAQRIGEAARSDVLARYNIRQNVAVLAAIFEQRVVDSPRLAAATIAAPPASRAG